jgi:PAS domain S-box-containing protein
VCQDCPYKEYMYDIRMEVADAAADQDFLRGSEGYFRSIFKNASEGIWITDAHGITTLVNPRMSQMLGYEPEDFIGRSYRDFLIPEDHARGDVGFALRKAGDEAPQEYRFRHRDGSTVCVTITASVLRDKSGAITDVVGMLTDVTAQRESQRQWEAALRLSEEKFRGIVEAASEGIWIISPEGRTQFVNPRVSEVLGYTPDEMIGRSCFDFIHPEDRHRAIEGLMHRKNGNLAPKEYRGLRRDGSQLWFCVTGTPIHDESGNVTSVLVMCTDVTERRRHDERIRQLNADLMAKVAELETLLSVAPVGIAFSYDVECRTIRFNPAAQQIHGVDSGVNPSKTGPAAADLPFRILRDGVEIPGEDLPVQLAARTGDSVRNVEYEVVHEDGRAIPVICSAVPLLNERGQLRGSVAAFYDITERKNMENALRRANAALEQFAYAAAHDLQEPVRNVIVYTQLLSRLYADKLDADADELVTHIVDGAKRMQSLIEGLLSYTRATNECEDASRVESDANAAFDDVVQNLHTAIAVAEASVSRSPLPRVAIRHVHFVQILQNLVSNALKYRGPEPPQVHVSAQRQSRNWIFTVQDNGQGIPYEHQQRIFRVFRRLHGRDIPGTGIGLAICERIVTYYGGRIWVDSEPGTGAAFRFTLPPAHSADRS